MPAADCPTLLTLYLEAVAEQGEDAEPLALEGRDGAVVLGVFDGLGGSGGSRYDVDGVERKGAYLASRLARKATEAVAKSMLLYLEERQQDLAAGAAQPPPNAASSESDRSGSFAPPRPTPGVLLASWLEERLRRDFEQAASSLGGEPSKLRSAMVRVLPTTAAIAMVEPVERRADSRAARRAVAVWAGDSRIYVLTPRGLEQVSRDDTRADVDAFTSLSTDPPIDNCISASERFELRRADWELDLPCVVIAATDGCFGYYPTPAHFELVLLRALTESSSFEECQRQLAEQIEPVARDDATLAAAVLHGGDFPSFRAALEERRAYVEEQFVIPFEWQQKRVRAADAELDAMTAEREARTQARDKCAAELWEQYRGRYERILAPAKDARR